MTFPLANITVTSPFGWRVHPTKHTRSFHNGVDLRAGIGTPVMAPFSGRLSFSSSRAGGKQAFVTHPGGLVAGFAHLSSYADGLQDGDVVQEGKVIAATGDTGIGTGPHLHFSLSVRDSKGDRSFMNPMLVRW